MENEFISFLISDLGCLASFGKPLGLSIFIIPLHEAARRAGIHLLIDVSPLNLM